MTLADIKNSIFRRTQTTTGDWGSSEANMVLAINAANERVHSLIRQWIDNFTPTAWTTSDLSTGTAVPKFDANFHDLIALYPSYERAVERGLPSANGFLTQIQMKEEELKRFYGLRNYQFFTVSIASPGVFTKNNHGLISGDRITLTTTGALPTGLSVDTYYFVIYATDDTFQVSSTKGGTAINTSGSQSGTHYYSRERQGRIRVSTDSNK